MRRPAQIARYWLKRSGWPGVAGLALLAFCLAFQFSAIGPARTRLEQLGQEAVSLRARVEHMPRQAVSDTPTEQLAAFYRRFPSGRSAPDWLEKVYLAAQQQSLPLERGEYRAVREKQGRLTRYSILLPVKGSYVQIRRFLAAVLADVPAASLDSVAFERQKIGDGAIEAKIRLTLYLEDGQ